MATARSGLVIRPVAQFLNGLSSLYQRPPNTIRNISEEGWFSPWQPVQPYGPPGTEPRGFQTWSGQNLIFTPRADAELSAADLKMLASYPLARICIENVKDTVTRAPWEIQIRPRPHETRQEVANRARGDQQLVKLNRFFEYPDREHNWQEWLRPLLDDMLVIDAPAILIRKTFKGDIVELPVIRGDMIVRYIDEQGWTPVPPSPAYAQNWWGLPLVNLTSDQLVYKPRNIVPRNTLSSQLYGMCYSSDTEILTRDRGFVLFSDLRNGDFVATRNANKEFEWQEPTAFIKEQYNGPMYAFASKCMDLQVTPPHRMLITTNHGKTEKVVTAEELAIGNHHERKIPVTSVWSGIEVGPKIFASEIAKRRIEAAATVVETKPGTFQCKSEYAGEPITFGEHGAEAVIPRNEKPVLMGGDQFCAFMGAYLAEGWTHESGVYISQLETSVGFKPYQKMLAGILGKKPKHTGRDFSIPRRGLRDYLKRFGLAHEKFVPQEILNSSIHQLNLFWEHFALGDGSVAHRESVSMRGNQPRLRTEFTTVSKRLADGLVEIAQKLGWSASVRLRKGGKQERFAGRESQCRDSYHVRVRYSSHMSVNAEKINYKGTVHCISVPNGIVYVRRNGKPAWCGNSPTEQMSPEIQVGIKRLEFVLSYYTEGSVPGVVQVVPRGTDPDKIEEAMEWMNSQLAGNLAARNQWRMVQGFNEPGKADQIIFSKEPLLAGLYDEKHIREIAFGYGTSPQRLMKMIRTEGKSSADAAEIEGTLPWVLWVKGVIDFIIQRKMGFPDYEIAINPYAEPDPLKNAAALTMLVSKAVLTPNEARKRVGEELRPEPEADRLGVITGTGFVPVGVPSVTAGVQIDEKGNPKPHPVTPSLPPGAGGAAAPNASRGGTPASQDAGGGRSTGRNSGTPSGKESLDGKKKIQQVFQFEKRLESRIEPDVLTPESHQATEHVKQAVHQVFRAQLGHALGIARTHFHKTLGNVLNKRQFGNVQFNLAPGDAQKVLTIPVNGHDFAAKARDVNPHVTVLWGFHPEVTSAQINAITKGIGSIDITLGALEAFPEGPDGVPLVIRIESEKLRKLNADLKALPHTETHPEYKPHICVAYLNPDAPAQDYVSAGNPLEGEVFTLSDLKYSGIDYTVEDLEKKLLPSERIRRAARGHFKKSEEERIPDPGEYDEAKEAQIREMINRHAAYAEYGPTYDPQGKYLCGDCSFKVGEDGCAVVSGTISMTTGSSRLWTTETIPKESWPQKLTQIESGYSERPKAKGFGCSRCEYAAKAIKPDSAGRPTWCSFWGLRVQLLACCSEEDGEDLILAPGEK